MIVAPHAILVASYDTADNETVEIQVSDGRYSILRDAEMVQHDLGADDVIRWMGNALHNTEHMARSLTLQLTELVPQGKIVRNLDAAKLSKIAKGPYSGQAPRLRTTDNVEQVISALRDGGVGFQIAPQGRTDLELNDRMTTIVTEADHMTEGEQDMLFHTLTSLRFRYPVIVIGEAKSDDLARVTKPFILMR